MRFLRRYSVLWAVVCCCAAAGAEEPVRYLTVEELFRLGVENSLQIKASVLNQQLAWQEEKAARTEHLPEVNISATGSYVGQPTVFRQGLRHGVHPDYPDWSQSYRAELAQPIYAGGRIRHTVTRAALEKQLADLSTERDKAALKLFLMEKYLNLFELYKERKVLDQNIEEAQRRLHDIRQRRKEGMLTQNDVIRSELQLTDYTLARQESENDIRIVSQQLDLILGLEETTVLEPDSNLLLFSPPVRSYEDYLSEAAENYPELKMARQNISIAQEDLSIVRAGYLPSLSLGASNVLGRPIAGSSPVQDVFMNSWNVSLALSYRIGSLYKNRRQVNISREMISLQENRQEQIRQELRRNIRAACIKHGEALDRVKALTLAVSQANENYRIVQNKYLNQLAILTDLLDASSVRLQAELQLTAARTNVIYTYYQLLRATGKL